MRFLLALTTLVLLAQCKTFHLPKPGDPVANDIDERSRREDAARPRDATERFSDPKAQSAFDDGYAAGFLDHHVARTPIPMPILATRRIAKPSSQATSLASPRNSLHAVLAKERRI